MANEELGCLFEMDDTPHKIYRPAVNPNGNSTADNIGVKRQRVILEEIRERPTAQTAILKRYE